MIVMQCKESRRFAGRIGPEGDLLDCLKNLCRTHNISTAEIRGVGYLRSARLAVYDPPTEAFVEEDAPGPPAQVLSMLGNVSQQGEELALHLQVQLLVVHGGERTIRGGRLVAGEVEDVEFFMETVDDFGFVRYPAADGLSPWMQVASDAHSAAEDASSRAEFLPGRLGSRGDEGEEYELKPGDRLRHPRLGACVVVQVPDEDRASIRLESGRVVELHMGLLKLVPLSAPPGAQKTYKVEIRRRG